jgi:hypothetical protein
MLVVADMHVTQVHPWCSQCSYVSGTGCTRSAAGDYKWQRYFLHPDCIRAMYFSAVVLQYLFTSLRQCHFLHLKLQ